MTFADLNKEMVSNFLHSAVLIDDQIEWSYWGQSGETFDEFEIEEPEEFELAEENQTPEDSAPLKSKLHAKPIIKSFSSHGIVCSPYTWGAEDDEFPNSSEKADLLILDWKLEEGAEEKGTYAKGFIKNRLEKDIKNKERLRFISIYTSEKQDDVLTPLKLALVEIPGAEVTGENNYLDIASNLGHKICRINVISKGAVLEDQLADKLIEDFLAFAGGFLPNILLSSVAEIRNKTYEYLAQYHSGLDHAVISHYTALKSQEETFDTAEMQFRQYVSNIVASSIQSSLSFSEYVKNASSKTAIIKYLEAQNALKLCSEDNECDDKSKIITILRSTNYEGLKKKVEKVLSLKSKKMRHFSDGKSPLFFKNPEYEAHLELSVLDLLKRTYRQNENSPVLKLGTILKHKDMNVFYLCVQPLCDGVRLDSKKTSGHSFPFLKLEPVEQGKFHFIAPYDGENLKFKCEVKPRNIYSFRFVAQEKTRDVRGSKRGKANYPYFHSTTDSFKWLGELKDVYAQETLNRLAHQGSRVGTDKFEWLRKQN